MPEQTERFIKKYDMFTHYEKILVAVSGGKDSLGLWDILVRLGYQADGLYLGLGIDEGINYSHESQRLAQKFADEHNLKLHIVDIEKEYGQPIPVLAEKSHRGYGKPCAVCGLAKRHEMNRVARVRVIVSDLRRSWIAAAGLWIASFPLRFHAVSRHDGVVSVMRGFTPEELGDTVREAVARKTVVHRRRAFRVTTSWTPVDR